MDASAVREEHDTVFVLDDDLAVRESLKFALELEGLAVEACAGPAELEAHPKVRRAACLVVDPNLPTLTEGFDMLERLAAHNVRPPVIVITSRASSRLRQRSRQFGVSRILEKPLLDGTLVDAIKHMVEPGERPSPSPA